MPSKKPRLATYTEQIIIDKLQFIADFEKRSASKQLEYIVENYITDFESKYGELVVGENSSITLAKPKAVKGKSSGSKIS
ncbi:MAG: hypothetical protein K0Q49_2380 [Haloplasmataceae bacterium]|jgi:hypothetical protein|nr:hypothetical protein [Haloplasmataceae bacterium]